MATIFLPKKINVGYQNRTDTYTKKLAYVIYYDQKGVLRKETSWQNWRDKKIDNNVFDNEPTEGFVLNKKVGGDSWSGWNHRQTYTRVYDPRGFEFEITIPNLLYILQNADCSRGKGLEGKFIYGWDGKDLLLIPEEAPEYKEHIEYSEMLTNAEKLKGADLVLGGTYRTSSNEDYIYLGRFDYWDNYWHKTANGDYDYGLKNKGKHYFFQTVKDGQYKQYMMLKSLSNKIVKTISTECVTNYSDLMDKLEGEECYSPYDKTKDTYTTLSLKELKKRVIKRNKDTVYFEYDGIQLTASLQSLYDYEKSEQSENWILYSIQRVHDLAESEYDYSQVPSWYGASSYRSHYRRDLKLLSIREKLEKELWSSESYYSRSSAEVKKYPSIEEQHKKFNFTVKKEFLANGREKR